MKGLMLTFLPYQSKPVVRELTAEPPLHEIKAGIGGGYLEAVPGFTSIIIDGKRWDCIAYCDEDGKHKNLETNNWATIQWEVALRNSGHPGLLDPFGRVVDWLVGPVVVLAGDQQFMRSMREDADAE